MTATVFRKVLAVSGTAIALAISVPSAMADEQPQTTAPSMSAASPSPNPEQNGRHSEEHGERLDREFDASHPLEWIAIGVAITLAVGLAYTAGRRKRDRE